MKRIKIIFMTVFLSSMFSVQALAGWIPAENEQWRYEQDGHYLSSQWIEEQNNWYYLDVNGIMLKNITENIGGVEYTFDDTGSCVNPDGTGVVTWNIYTNAEAGYSIKIPSDVTTDAFDGATDTFDISSSNMMISIYGYVIPQNLDPVTYATYFEMGFYDSLNGKLSLVDKTEVQLGGLTFYKTRYTQNGSINMDTYSCSQNQKLIFIATMYVPSTQEKVQEILNTLTSP